MESRMRALKLSVHPEFISTCVQRYVMLLRCVCQYEFVRASMPAQVRVNFPNGDMVGHTGKLEATITACTATDKAVKVWDEPTSRSMKYVAVKNSL